MAKFLRDHENPYAAKAGVMALAVHLVLLGAMLVSINWKAAHPIMHVTEVELWDKLPAKAIPSLPKPEPKPLPEVKPEPKVEPPEPPKAEPKVEEKAQEKVDIELEKLKQQKLEKEREEKRKQEQLEKIKQQAREDELREKKLEEQRQKDKLKKLQEEMLHEENAAEEKQVNVASASEVAAYTEKIKAKIRGNVNKTLCGSGNPELRFEISVLPTGDLGGNPRLTKSSGNTACDEAVERAIIASEPLPVPSDAALMSKFRNMNLKFRPND